MEIMVARFTRREFAALTGLVAAGASLAGCQGKAVDRNAEAHKAAIIRFTEVQNSGDLNAIRAAIDELNTEDYVLHDPSWTDPIRGIAASKRFAAEVFNPDQEVTIEQIAAEGDLVAIRAILRGTGTATGKPWTAEIMVFSRFVGDKIAEEWQVLAQVGATS
jgi:predicted SnoaL-like aldol condensation-catalyzing enzyme